MSMSAWTYGTEAAAGQGSSSNTYDAGAGGTYSSTTNQLCGIRLKTNGGLYKVENGSETFLNWYITPNSAQSSLDEVRITSRTGDALSGQPAADGTWIAISTTRTYYNQDTDPSATGSKSTTFTLELRYNGGSVKDSASYTLNADYETV